MVRTIHYACSSSTTRLTGPLRRSLEKHLAAAAKDKGKAKAKNTTADIRDITLDEDFGAYGGALDFGGDELGLDFGGIDDMGFDPEFQLFGDDELDAIAGPSGEKRGTKRARDEDGEERDEDDVSVEQGRRDSVAHASERGSIGPFDLSINKDAEGDMQMADNDLGGFDAGFELGFDAPDFNNDFGGGFDEQREKSESSTVSLLRTVTVRLTLSLLQPLRLPRSPGMRLPSSSLLVRLLKSPPARTRSSRPRRSRNSSPSTRSLSSSGRLAGSKERTGSRT